MALYACGNRMEICQTVLGSQDPENCLRRCIESRFCSVGGRVMVVADVAVERQAAIIGSEFSYS